MPRRRGKSKPHRSNSLRKAPRPISWDCPRGWCRFCGGEIIEDGKQNRRKHWHQSCADRWRLINNPAEMRRFVYEREGGVCEGCQKRVYDWPKRYEDGYDADHIKPLFEAYGDISYWEPENVQLLCKVCHKEKTKQDMILFRKIDGITYSETTD